MCEIPSGNKWIVFINGNIWAMFITEWHRSILEGDPVASLTWWQYDTKGVSMYHKKYYLGRYSILSYLLSRQVCLLTFKAGMIEPVPLAFKASEMSAAPLVPYYTSTVSQIWTGRWMGINPSYLSAHSMFTLETKIIAFYTYPLCFFVIWSQTNQKCE